MTVRLFDAPLTAGRPPMARFELDDPYLSMIRNGGARMPDDLADLNEEFPAWGFSTSWVTVGSGPDRRRIWAWSLEHLDRAPLVAFDAEEMRRQIREATD